MILLHVKGRKTRLSIITSGYKYVIINGWEKYSIIMTDKVV